jgi:tetratricopeptide (TPR) repeat protein
MPNANDSTTRSARAVACSSACDERALGIAPCGVQHAHRFALLAGLILACACRSTDPALITDAASTREGAAHASAQQDWAAAAKQWHSVSVSEKGHGVDACLNAADALERLGKLDCAERVLENGLEARPDSELLLKKRGDILVARGFERCAERCFEQAVAIAPDWCEAWRALGLTRAHLGLDVAASDALQQAVVKGCGDYETLILLASSSRNRDPVGAREAYARAFRSAPKIGNGEPAVKDLVAAASLCVDDRVREVDPKALDTMQTWLDRALAIAPQCCEAHFELGVRSEALHDEAGAIAHYEHALQLDPNCLGALSNLALIYTSRDELDNARRVVRRALAVETHPDRKRALERLVGSTSALAELK